MKRLRSHLTVVRIVSIVSIGAFFPSCTKWSAKPLQPERFAETQNHRSVRLTFAGGGQVVVTDPQFENDSLIWMAPQYGTAGGPLVRTGRPLSDIAKVEVRQFDAVGTVVLVAGVSITLAILAAAAENSGTAPPPSSNPPSTGCTPQSIGCGSCPVVYSWDGTDWRLDSGTFGGAVVEALARTDVDNLDFAKPEGRIPDSSSQTS
jgi:hypothetical protein